MKRLTTASVTVVAMFCLTAPSYAYIDPGIAGSVFQVGYLIFYGFIAAMAFCFRPIKSAFLSLKSKLGFGGPAVASIEADAEAPIETEASIEAEAEANVEVAAEVKEAG